MEELVYSLPPKYMEIVIETSNYRINRYEYDDTVYGLEKEGAYKNKEGMNISPSDKNIKQSMSSNEPLVEANDHDETDHQPCNYLFGRKGSRTWNFSFIRW